MAWIEVHQSLKDHWKTLTLAAALDIEPVQAMGHLVSFWLWAVDNVPSGCLSKKGCALIAYAAQWRGDASRFSAAMIEAGFLEVDSEGQTWIHDWDEYIGRLNDRRERNAERMRAYRAEVRAKYESVTPDERAMHVQNTNDARDDVVASDEQDTFGETVPNRTIPNHEVHACVSSCSIQKADSQAETTKTPTAEPSYQAERVKPAAKRKRPGDTLEGFEEFRAVYPRSIAWANAAKQWPKALAVVTQLRPDNPVNALVLAAKGYAADCKSRAVEDRYICMPATWLNQERYRDFLPGSVVDFLEKRQAELAKLAESPAPEPESPPSTKTLSELDRERVAQEAANPTPVRAAFVPKTFRHFRQLTGSPDPVEPEPQAGKHLEGNMRASLLATQQAIQAKLAKQAPPEVPPNG